MLTQYAAGSWRGAVWLASFVSLAKREKVVKYKLSTLNQKITPELGRRMISKYEYIRVGG